MDASDFISNLTSNTECHLGSRTPRHLTGTASGYRLRVAFLGLCLKSLVPPPFSGVQSIYPIPILWEIMMPTPVATHFCCDLLGVFSLARSHIRVTMIHAKFLILSMKRLGDCCQIRWADFVIWVYLCVNIMISPPPHPLISKPV